MKMNRNYPTPDTKRLNCGPRERALATFKYLLGIEPEEAKDHPRFAMMVHAFEQSNACTIRSWMSVNGEDTQAIDGEPEQVLLSGCFEIPVLGESLEEELTGERII